MPFHVTFGLELPVLTVSATIMNQNREEARSTPQLKPKVPPAVLRNYTEDMQDQVSNIWQPSVMHKDMFMTAKGELILQADSVLGN